MRTQLEVAGGGAPADDVNVRALRRVTHFAPLRGAPSICRDGAMPVGEACCPRCTFDARCAEAYAKHDAAAAALRDEAGVGGFDPAKQLALPVLFDSAAHCDAYETQATVADFAATERGALALRLERSWLGLGLGLGLGLEVN